jgi:dCMP deaminase
MLAPEKARKHLNIARNIASEFSKDKSTQVGCLITTQDGSPLSWGYNGFPRGVMEEHAKRHERPAKYLWTEHAERNAIYNASRVGVSLMNSRMFVTRLCLCPDCARAAIQSGVKEVYLELEAFKESEASKRWLEHWKSVTFPMLSEADVEVEIVR